MSNPYISGEEFANNPRYTAEWFLRKAKIERKDSNCRVAFEDIDDMYNFLYHAERHGIRWSNGALASHFIPQWNGGDLYIIYKAGALLQGRITSVSNGDIGRINIIYPAKEKCDEFDVASDADFCDLLTQGGGGNG